MRTRELGGTLKKPMAVWPWLGRKGLGTTRTALRSPAGFETMIWKMEKCRTVAVTVLPRRSTEEINGTQLLVGASYRAPIRVLGSAPERLAPAKENVSVTAWAGWQPPQLISMALSAT